MYYKTVCSVWAETADAAWDPVLEMRHLLLLRGGTGLTADADSGQIAQITPGATVLARICDAYYPPMQVAILAQAFTSSCTPTDDPGEQARAIIKLCTHQIINAGCMGCWARWWLRRARDAGIPLPARTLTGAEL